jgi:hypothetical protein
MGWPFLFLKESKTILTGSASRLLHAIVKFDVVGFFADLLLRLAEIGPSGEDTSYGDAQ